jgi:hypothetical protein
MAKKTKKFDYGKELFADPNYLPEKRYNNKDYIKFLKGVYQDVELNTADEKRAFKQIYDYFKDPSNLISKDVLESLKKLRDRFPNILNPLYDNVYNAYLSDLTYYRGGSLSAEQLSGLSFERGKIYKKEKFELNKAIIKEPKFVYETTGEKHYLSFSRSFETALEFALNPFYNKRKIKQYIKSNRIPVVIGISGNDKNLILNPDFSDAVSPYFEDESLYISNRMKIKELYIINVDLILDMYDKIDQENKTKHTRDKLRFNIEI